MIKEGGHLDIYYVASSELEANVKEGYRKIDIGIGRKMLIPSISEVITLNKAVNNKLTVNIYIFTCDIFFREYLNSSINNVFSPNTYLDRNYSKL